MDRVQGAQDESEGYASFEHGEQHLLTNAPVSIWRVWRDRSVKLFLVLGLALLIVALQSWSGSSSSSEGSVLHPQGDSEPAQQDRDLIGNDAQVSVEPTSSQQNRDTTDVRADNSLVCGSDRAAVGSTPPEFFRASQTWTQEESETLRVKLWGGGGMGGPAVRLVPAEGECSVDRKLRAGRGGGSGSGGGGRSRASGASRGPYTGSRTRADLNNHANQLNPNNWRYWSSRGMQPPWESGSSARPATVSMPYRPDGQGIGAGNNNGRSYIGTSGGTTASARTGYTGTGTRADLNNHANQLNPNNWRYWRSRGVPLSVALRYAKYAATLASKWLPRRSRWRVDGRGRRLNQQIDSCGEVWLCGGGGGAGAFTEAIVDFKAGHRYAIEVGQGGRLGTPDGSATRLVELTVAGRVAMLEARGGLGSAAVDEERLVALGGSGAPASPWTAGLQQSLPGGEGAASRSDFEDLPYEQLLLARANLSAARALSATDLANSLSAIRIPCATGARNIDLEHGLAATATLTRDLGYTDSHGVRMYSTLREVSAPSAPSRGSAVFKRQVEDPVVDHMLVCLPAASATSGAYDSNTMSVGDRVRLICAMEDDFGTMPRGTLGTIRHFSDSDTNFDILVEMDAPFNGRTRTIGSEEKCLEVIRPFRGSQCLGAACVRAYPEAPCEGLPSCLNGLAAWIGVLDLGSSWADAFGSDPFHSYGPYINVSLSASGPKGGVALAVTPDGVPSGHGGDGSCPELTPEDGSLANSKPTAPRPHSGRDGLAVFYKCTNVTL